MYKGYSPYDNGRGESGRPAEIATAVLASRFGYSHDYHPKGQYDIDHYISRGDYTLQVESSLTLYWLPEYKTVHWNHRTTDHLNIPLRKAWMFKRDCLYITWRKDCNACVFFYPKQVYDAGLTYETDIYNEPFISVPNSAFNYWYEGDTLDPFNYHPPQNELLWDGAA